VNEPAGLRLRKGENLELVSRQTGFALHELSRWRDKFIMGERENLKSHPQDPLHAELEQRDKLISKLALENQWRDRKVSQDLKTGMFVARKFS